MTIVDVIQAPSALTRSVLLWLRCSHDIDLTDLPKGSVDDGYGCPVALALQKKYGPEAWVDHAVFSTGDGETSLPGFVSEWVELFDDGRYPDYREGEVNG